MARKRLLTLMLSAIFLLCFVGSALAAGPARRYVGSSTAKGAIYQSSYRVDVTSVLSMHKSVGKIYYVYENDYYLDSNKSQLIGHWTFRHRSGH